MMPSEAIQSLLLHQGGNISIQALPVMCYTGAHTQLLLNGYRREEFLLESWLGAEGNS